MKTATHPAPILDPHLASPSHLSFYFSPQHLSPPDIFYFSYLLSIYLPTLKNLIPTCVSLFGDLSTLYLFYNFLALVRPSHLPHIFSQSNCQMPKCLHHWIIKQGSLPLLTVSHCTMIYILYSEPELLPLPLQLKLWSQNMLDQFLMTLWPFVHFLLA